jgi:hypothetical protein
VKRLSLLSKRGGSVSSKPEESPVAVLLERMLSVLMGRSFQSALL